MLLLEQTLVAHKLSASALSTYLRSPKAFYWRYRAGLEPVAPTVATFDDAKVCGQIWSEFVSRYYDGMPEEMNTQVTLGRWHEQTDGWVPDKSKDKLTKALESWISTYYQQFSPKDGCRTQSEVFVENDRFLGYLDGLNEKGQIHETKTTSRSPQLSGQLWRIQNSIQVKLYAVLTQASGVCIEISFKDPPYAIFRAPVLDITAEQRKGWEQELNTLADHIYSLGDDPNNYTCNSDGCNLVTRGVTSMCSYHTLCDMGLNETTQIIYQPRTNRRK